MKSAPGWNTIAVKIQVTLKPGDFFLKITFLGGNKIDLWYNKN